MKKLFEGLPDFGEMKCPECKKIFFTKKALVSHYGGAHRRGTMQEKELVCKHCGEELIKDKNWPKWAYTNNNIICRRCTNLRNRKSYIKNKMNKMKKFKGEIK